MIANRLFHRDKSPRSKGLTLPWAVSAASLLFLSVLVARAPAATPPNCAAAVLDRGAPEDVFAFPCRAPLLPRGSTSRSRDPTVPGPLLRALLKPTGKQQPSKASGIARDPGQGPNHRRTAARFGPAANRHAAVLRSKRDRVHGARRPVRYPNDSRGKDHGRRGSHRGRASRTCADAELAVGCVRRTRRDGSWCKTLARSASEGKALPVPR